ncbi:DUF924 family protein [Reinekea marinisedimentorum]|uniref:Uncharacterized protein (DUF924 family) n=1 Tax=Reinekea marinisedimentorum TaxID=230495 RepID=A0A4R3IEE2_9GAMM|nr:DUF924 family protein [Reinekea marinisedimentorum]TCS43968.1 uncharacterized protein (DUF924 family) [Reinekea marinisedimentorum]
MTEASIWNEVLDYWFNDQSLTQKQRTQRWFDSNEETDAEIRQKFLIAHSQLTTGSIHFDETSGEQRLAAIVLIDQFSRNLYRKSATAFAWDHLAVKWAQEGWKLSQFDNLSAVEKGFSLMPLVHSEDIALHDDAIERLTELKKAATAMDTIITGFHSSALEHRDIIVQFGRYPHRNEVLNRPSTEAELAYLNKGAKRFGQ